MKALLIATDLILDDNNEVKIIEMNTNAGIYDTMIDTFDFTELINLVTENNINEVHYIYSSKNNTFNNNEITYDANGVIVDRTLNIKLKEIFEGMNLTFVSHRTNANAITVPFIEDSETKLILRQSYDTTALIDETYCADKFNLQELINGQSFSIPTYIKEGEVLIDTLTQLKPNSPNIIMKSRVPEYTNDYPRLYTIGTIEELNELKNTLSDGYYLQEFVNSNNNLYENRYGIVRSVDIVYGNTLEHIHLGSYTNTSLVDVDIWENNMVTGTNYLDDKSRTKWTNKPLGDKLNIEYHMDDETKIIDSENNQIDLDLVVPGKVIKSVEFTGFMENENPATIGNNSTFDEVSNSLSVITTTVVEKNNQEITDLFVTIELEGGIIWKDHPTSKLYVEDVNSTVTHFKNVNWLNVGDNVILLDTNNNVLVKKQVENLTISFETNIVYSIDVEQQDLFIVVVDETNSLSLIQHNVDCAFCDPPYNPYNCGGYRCNPYPQCGCGGTPKL